MLEPRDTATREHKSLDGLRRFALDAAGVGRDQGWPDGLPAGARQIPTREAHRQVIRELVARDKNHPCVAVWCIANEPESDTPASRAYFEPLAAETRRLDPSRPVGFVNAWAAELGKPIIMTEYGADTLPGLHSVPPAPWTEKYQAELPHRVFDRVDKAGAYLLRRRWRGLP